MQGVSHVAQNFFCRLYQESTGQRPTNPGGRIGQRKYDLGLRDMRIQYIESTPMSGDEFETCLILRSSQ